MTPEESLLLRSAMYAEFRNIVEGWRLPKETGSISSWDSGYENALLNVLSTLKHKEFYLRVKLEKSKRTNENFSKEDGK